MKEEHHKTILIEGLQQGLRGYDEIAAPVWDHDIIEAFEDHINYEGSSGWDVVSPTLAIQTRMPLEYKVWLEVPNYWDYQDHLHEEFPSARAYFEHRLKEINEQGYSLAFQDRGFDKECFEYRSPQPAIIYCWKRIVPLKEIESRLHKSYRSTINFIPI